MLSYNRWIRGTETCAEASFSALLSTPSDGGVEYTSPQHGYAGSLEGNIFGVLIHISQDLLFTRIPARRSQYLLFTAGMVGTNTSGYTMNSSSGQTKCLLPITQMPQIKEYFITSSLERC
jgi:hypothetical protein